MNHAQCCKSIVMVIDDSPEDRETYRRYLLQDQQYQYQIWEEEYGEKGLELCRINKPDLILLDYRLPDIDGLSLLQELRSNLEDNCPPVVILTGQGNEAIAVEAMKQGAQDYLVKQDITPESLQLTIRNVLEKAYLRRQLQEKETRFRTSIENMLDCFGIYTSIRDRSGQIVDFKIEYVNAAACQDNQMTKEEQIGKRLCEIWPNHREIGLFADYCRVVETGEALEKESVIYSKNPNNQSLLKAFDIRATKLGDGFVASWRDVTEKKQAEEELKKQQRLIEQIALATPDLLYLYDLEKQQNVYVNRQIDRLLGYTPEEIQQMGTRLFAEIMHPDDLTQHLSWTENLKSARDGEVLEFEYRLRHANGEWRWINSRDIVFSRASDGSVQQTLGIARDITERKQTEEALRQSEERFRVALQNSPIIVFHQDTELRYTWMYNPNRAFDPKAFVGKTDAELFSTEDAERLTEIKREVLMTGKGMRTETDVTVNAEKQHYDLAVEPLHNQEGKVVGITCVATDITKRKRMESERSQLLEEARAANQAKDLFLSIVSHELRNPLNAILGYTYLLRQGNLNQATAERAWETIERNVKLQAQMIDDLLDISRITSGKLRLDLKPTNLVLAIEAAIDTVRLTAQAKEIEIKASFDLNAVWVWGDVSRLQQIVGNLLSNAIKFTPTRGHIQVTHKRVGNWVEVAVSDTGRGISPEFLPNVFERFRQDEKPGEPKGLGLGLAIVRHLVELLGGSVWAQSPGEGQGSTFIFRLPLIENEKD